jgi:hypothetical protein
MSSAPARNTWPMRKPPQTRVSSAAAAPKSPAREASTAALIAPAEVPHSTANGSGDPGGYQLAIALSMPTW